MSNMAAAVVVIAGNLATLRRLRRKPLLRISDETAEVFGRLNAKLNMNHESCWTTSH